LAVFAAAQAGSTLEADAAARAAPAAGRVPASWAALPIVAGLLALYVPTYLDQAASAWQTEQLRHGPLVALGAAWLFWRCRAGMLRARPIPSDVLGLPLLLLGLVAYVVGRSQEIPLLEVGSQVPLAAAIVLLTRGTHALRAAAFALLFLAFMVPLPGIFVDTVTGTLKVWVSVAVEEILFLAGLPIARSGVVLTLGHYQLLMADACSGLHSMITLSALGLLFLHLMGRAGIVHNGLLMAAILPVAFAANVARVLALALATYYLGERAAQGLLHDMAGLLLFVVALAAMFTIDVLLYRTLRRPSVAGAEAL
jgi:exosortase B